MVRGFPAGLVGHVIITQTFYDQLMHIPGALDGGVRAQDVPLFREQQVETGIRLVYPLLRRGGEDNAAVSRHREPVLPVRHLGRTLALHLLRRDGGIHSFVVEHPKPRLGRLIVKAHPTYIIPPNEELQQSRRGKVRQTTQRPTIYLGQQSKRASLGIQRPGHIMGQVGRTPRLTLKDPRLSQLQGKPDGGAVVLGMDLRCNPPGQLIHLAGIFPGQLVVL